MTIPLTGTGSLFKRVGRNTYNLNSLNSYLGVVDLSAASIVSLGTGIDNINGQYLAADQELVSGLYPSRYQLRQSVTGFPFYLQSLAQDTLIKMVNDDTILSSLTVPAAMTILISQMTANSETVLANTVSVAVTTGASNIGTAICIASVKGPDGKNREYVNNETIVAMAATDSQGGTATAGSEQWVAAGELSQSNPLAFDWPLGSGASNSYTSQDAGAGVGYLANGDFEDWTVANIPDNWSIVIGTAGGTVFKESTLIFRGTYALKILGNGSELTCLKQLFNQSSGSGTSFNLLPNTVYAFNVWLRMSSVPSAGTIVFELTDSAGTIINNDQGVANRATKALTAATTSYAPVSGFFQTPRVLPTTTPFNLRIRLTVALDNAKSCYLDDIVLVPGAEFYQGGPYIAIIPGATATVIGDFFNVAVANNWGGGFQKVFQRYYGMTQLGMQLPSATSGNTISEALIG